MMKRTLAVAAIWFALSPVAAMAGTILTPALYTGTLTTSVVCEAFNVGDKPIDSVTVTLVPALGVGDAMTCTDLQPTAFCQDSAFAPPPFSSFFCRVPSRVRRSRFAPRSPWSAPATT